MIVVIDTNIVSELMKPEPHGRVSSYIDALDPASIFLTSITVAEIRYGIGRMPAGHRQARLRAAADDFFELVGERTLAFTPDSAREYADLTVEREIIGKPITVFDAMIAAICREVEATLVTRNVRDFADVGLKVINPWEIPPLVAG